MTPLEGLRILSLEVWGAGPYGSQLLSAAGADVIKIENPVTGGDPSRYVGPNKLGPADSQYFQGWNTNKRSVALDLKTPDGQRDFHRLVGSADAVMNNLRGDQPGKLGLDYATLSEFNPAVVCLHLSAYGRDNERAAWPGFDFLMQAEAGLMSLTGDPDGPPARFGPSIIDYMTGTTAMVGMLSCLLGARRTGKGCDVDVSLFDVALHQLGYAGTWCLNSDMRPTRQARSSHFSVAPVQTFPTADGWIFIMCMNQKFWLELLRVLGQEQLADEPRFADPNIRHDNIEAINAALDPIFGQATTAVWLERLSGVLPVAPVYDPEQALTSPFVAASGMIQNVPHPEKSDLRLLTSPIRIDGRRAKLTPCPPLGADNDELLQQ
ncbi:MAG: CoA transferase [Gammaproteobacteria bacterium]|jgi:crotonobetainyl-CoA:carnitine CoA-transferase CaiB-like acyl-CoA transferase